MQNKASAGVSFLSANWNHFHSRDRESDTVAAKPENEIGINSTSMLPIQTDHEYNLRSFRFPENQKVYW
jgi:hypothetical protein